MPIARMNEVQSETDKNQDGNDFEHNHHVVRFGGFANSAHQNNGKQHDDNQSRKVEAKCHPGP